MYDEVFTVLWRYSEKRKMAATTRVFPIPSVIVADDEIFRREPWDSYRVSQDPKVLAHARAHQRIQSGLHVFTRPALHDFDVSFPKMTT